MQRHKNKTVEAFSIPVHLGKRMAIWSGPRSEFEWPRQVGTSSRHYIADIVTFSRPFYSFAISQGDTSLVLSLFKTVVPGSKVFLRMLAKAVLQKKFDVFKALLQLGTEHGIISLWDPVDIT